MLATLLHVLMGVSVAKPIISILCIIIVYNAHLFCHNKLSSSSSSSSS